MSKVVGQLTKNLLFNYKKLAKEQKILDVVILFFINTLQLRS